MIGTCDSTTGSPSHNLDGTLVGSAIWMPNTSRTTYVSTGMIIKSYLDGTTTYLKGTSHNTTTSYLIMPSSQEPAEQLV